MELLRKMEDKRHNLSKDLAITAAEGGGAAPGTAHNGAGGIAAHAAAGGDAAARPALVVTPPPARRMEVAEGAEGELGASKPDDGAGGRLQRGKRPLHSQPASHKVTVVSTTFAALCPLSPCDTRAANVCSCAAWPGNSLSVNGLSASDQEVVG